MLGTAVSHVALCTIQLSCHANTWALSKTMYLIASCQVSVLSGRKLTGAPSAFKSSESDILDNHFFIVENSLYYTAILLFKQVVFVQIQCPIAQLTGSIDPGHLIRIHLYSLELLLTN